MVITVTADMKAIEIDKKLKKMQKLKNKDLSNFYGKLKGVFGDGLAYQKNVRDEWN